MRPSYEELEQKLQAAEKKIEFLQALLTKALDRIAELEHKLNRNSKNSSKSPSSDQKSNTQGSPPQTKKFERGSPGLCIRQKKSITRSTVSL